jgi:hypothetical protein
MKALLIFSIFSGHVFALTLGQYSSSLDGTSVQAFDLNPKSVIYNKRSNLFDSKKDLSVGRFELERGQVENEKSIIIQALQKVQVVDKYLKGQNSTFNELSSKKPHESFIFLEDYRISQNSDLYPGLKSVFDNLMAKKWKQIDGARLSDDLKSISEMANGKVISTKPFHLLFSCNSGDVPTVCRYKDEGLIFIR